MSLSPREAIHRLNETVIVEMVVCRAKACNGSGRVFLDSEASYRDPNNLGVVITPGGCANFRALGFDDLARHFQGQRIRVCGVVRLEEQRPAITVENPSQVELVSLPGETL